MCKNNALWKCFFVSRVFLGCSDSTWEIVIIYYLILFMRVGKRGFRFVKKYDIQETCVFQRLPGSCLAV